MNMEANPLTLAIVGVILVALVVFILIRNNKDKKDFYKSMNAAEDQSLLIEKGTNAND